MTEFVVRVSARETGWGIDIPTIDRQDSVEDLSEVTLAAGALIAATCGAVPGGIEVVIQWPEQIAGALRELDGLQAESARIATEISEHRRALTAAVRELGGSSQDMAALLDLTGVPAESAAVRARTTGRRGRVAGIRPIRPTVAGGNVVSLAEKRRLRD